MFFRLLIPKLGLDYDMFEKASKESLEGQVFAQKVDRNEDMKSIDGYIHDIINEPKRALFFTGDTIEAHQAYICKDVEYFIIKKT